MAKNLEWKKAEDRFLFFCDILIAISQRKNGRLTPSSGRRWF
ncbi:hypothetical protein A343_2288 [Porphyromonas gingivalis JCVI SC001]|nr:hypothetical protein A343_2288 [Porphyromonas gingivalis JCVI SC001]